MSPQHAILRAVDADEPRRRTFCGYCGTQPAVEPKGDSRVCAACELGLLLSADEQHAPGRADAFLVVDAGLSIQALSKGAEKLFGVLETDLVGQPVENALVAAESSDEARDKLNRLLTGAAHAPLGERETEVVRPARAFGVRYRATVGRCEPGRAALVVLSAL